MWHAYLILLVEEVPHLSVHLLVDDETTAVVPVAIFHRFRGSHDVLTHALRWTHQWLSLRHTQNVVEVLTDHPAPSVKLMCYTGNKSPKKRRAPTS